jgi:hypothetical protein
MCEAQQDGSQAATQLTGTSNNIYNAFVACIHLHVYMHIVRTNLSYAPMTPRGGFVPVAGRMSITGCARANGVHKSTIMKVVRFGHTQFDSVVLRAV